MGMEPYPASGYVISWDKIKELCPIQAERLESACESEGISLDEYAAEEPNPDGEGAVDICFSALLEEFEKITEVNGMGLELNIFHYNSEDGGRYDELKDGANWSVEGMTTLSPAGVKFNNLVGFQRWTVLG